MPGYLSTGAVPSVNVPPSFTGASNPNPGFNSGPAQSPDFFGTGTYQVQPYQIDQNAFNNPVSTNTTAPGFQAGQAALLGAAGQATPTIGPAATSNGAGNQGQLATANTLAGIGNGTIQGAAAKTAALQGMQNQQANLSAMGSARGTANPALANYNLGVQNAAVQNSTAQNAVTGAAQEQLGALGAANQAYGGVTQNQQFNAQQIQQNAIQQATLQAQQMGLQGQELQNYIANNAQQIANSMSGAQAGQQLAVQNNLGENQIQSGAFNNAANNSIGGDVVKSIGPVVGALGAAAMMSDRTKKTKIIPGRPVLDKFLSSVRKGKK